MWSISVLHQILSFLKWRWKTLFSQTRNDSSYSTTFLSHPQRDDVLLSKYGLKTLSSVFTCLLAQRFITLFIWSAMTWIFEFLNLDVCITSTFHSSHAQAYFFVRSCVKVMQRKLPITRLRHSWFSIVKRDSFLTGSYQSTMFPCYISYILRSSVAPACHERRQILLVVVQEVC